MTIHHASCRCGHLSLSFSNAPMTQLICHCADCRDASGEAFTSVVFFAAEPSNKTGESRCVSGMGGSGKPKHSHLCRACGDFVYAEIEVLKGLTVVNGRCLGAPFAFTPEAHVWVSQKLPDTHIPDDAVVFQRAPSLHVVLKSPRASQAI